MKIGFLGNTNNYPFLLAYELRNKADILFFVDAGKDFFLDRPETYSGNLISYPYPPNFIENPGINNPTINSYFPFVFSKKIIRQLNSCDAVILNGFGHYYLPFLRRSLISISVFSGSDLDVTFNWELRKEAIRREKNFLKKIKMRLALSYTHYILKKSIERTDLVSYFPKGLYPDADKILSEAKNGKPYERFEHMHLSTQGIEYIPPPNNEVIKIFNAARFVWNKPFPPGMNEGDNKKNDVMIRGLAMFIKRTGCALDINFVEKGIDTDATKQLAKGLGIEKYVTWHKNMTHADFLKSMADSDIITDNMNEHVIGGGAFGMLLGRPLIGNAIPSVVKRITGKDSAICHAETEEDVYHWLQKLVLDKSFRENKGRESREYIIKHHNLTEEANYFFDFIQKKINLDKKYN